MQDRMNKLISRYLLVLGIVQLIGLNLGGIFWLFWSKGISRRKSSSRYWVLSIHTLYLALCTVILAIWLFQPDTAIKLKVYGSNIEAGRMVILAFLLTSYIVYGLPVIWLMRKDIKIQFIEQGVAGYDPQAAALHTPPHGAHLSSTARGSSPER